MSIVLLEDSIVKKGCGAIREVLVLMSMVITAPGTLEKFWMRVLSIVPREKSVDTIIERVRCYLGGREERRQNRYDLRMIRSCCAVHFSPECD